MHCAPLQIEGYTETVILSNISQSQVFYYYGPGDLADYTFMLKLPIHDFEPGDYRVTSQAFSSHSSKIIPELYKPDADVTLHLLDASGIFYRQPIDDPWFSATTRPAERYKKTYDEVDGSPLFFSDFPGSVIACASQILYCNPDLPSRVGCVTSRGDLLGANPANQSDGISALWSDPKDRSMVRPIMGLLDTGLITDGVDMLRTVLTLLARRTLLGSFQTALLSVDHWKLEQEQLYKTSLAYFQSMVVISPGASGQVQADYATLETPVIEAVAVRYDPSLLQNDEELR
ncbi:hypothetical protein E8E12_003374 [Didymella heteroderae]|uniref:Uncharacterized protein n=1 Tax=Didymella heteroderae TaxID=1769908 RepID=A0A9P5C1U4_9PLEO|nr:hypothetical protein E8E12_003374 [Didymella heteroderae]